MIARILVFLLWMPVAAFAQVQQLTHAHATILVEGKEVSEDVTLPYHWDRRQQGRSGRAEFDIPFDLSPAPHALDGIYFRRLGNAYEIWLNGSLLQRNGDLDAPDGSDFAKAPRYVFVPHQLVRGSNVLKVRIRADGGRRGGIAAPVLGPEAAIRPMFENEQRWRVEGSFAVVILSLLVGGGAALLWLTQVDASKPPGEGRDSLYLFAAAAEIAWALRVADAIIEDPPIDWTWWGTLETAALAVWLSSMAIVCTKLAGWDTGRYGQPLRIFLLVFVVAGSACGFASFQFDRTWFLTAWFLVAAVFFTIFGTVFIASAWRSSNKLHRLVAIALGVNVAVGIRDALVFRLAESYGDNSYIRYSSVLFGMVVGYVVLTRFQLATTQARELMHDLETRIGSREAELMRSYESLEKLAREQERTLERSRILRDMHDGVGAHITSAIRQLESGKATRPELLQTLRDSLDHLKLSIDSVHLPPGDVAALLANLRYRLDARFSASDVALRWEVEVISTLPRLDSSAMRHLQFMVFEAISNVLQHARASVLRIEASNKPDGIQVRLVDNGVGFDTSVPFRKGLLSMHDRAVAIGAQLSLSSSDVGTTVEIAIPF